MSNYEVDIFNTVYEQLEWAQCQVRIGRTVIEKAVMAGATRTRESTDQGQFEGVGDYVRMLAADEPSGGIENGTVIEVKQGGKDAWLKVRVRERFTQGGVTRLMLEAEHE